MAQHHTTGFLYVSECSACGSREHPFARHAACSFQHLDPGHSSSWCTAPLHPEENLSVWVRKPYIMEGGLQEQARLAARGAVAERTGHESLEKVPATQRHCPSPPPTGLQLGPCLSFLSWDMVFPACPLAENRPALHLAPLLLRFCRCMAGKWASL